MAVDYFHRLLITGAAAPIRKLVRGLHREYPRRVGRESWTEIVPFSFAALYELAPRAVRIEPEVPFDAFEMSAWPVRRLPRGKAEARYQFQTRSLELAPFIRALARVHTSLEFTVATLCLDDSSVESWFFSKGRTRKRTVPERRRDAWWARAGKKFKLEGEDLYDDDDAQVWAEGQMVTEALAQWRPEGPHRDRILRYRWWDQPQWRDLDTERTLAVASLAHMIAEGAEAAPAPRRTRRSRRRRT